MYYKIAMPDRDFLNMPITIQINENECYVLATENAIIPSNAVEITEEEFNANLHNLKQLLPQVRTRSKKIISYLWMQLLCFIKRP